MADRSPQNGSRTRKGADRRREILSAAGEVFSAKGYEQASMAEIAAKVGVVEGAIYKHFGSKRELLFETTRAFYEPLIAATERELAGVQGTRNRLRFVIFRHLRSFVSHPELCRLIIREIRPFEDYYGSVVRELNRKTTSRVLSILEDAKRAGELRPGVRPALVRDVIFGGIEHLAWKSLSGRGKLDVDGQADGLTELILHGILASPSERSEHAEHFGPPPEIVRLREQVDRLEKAITAMTVTTTSKKTKKRA